MQPLLSHWNGNRKHRGKKWEKGGVFWILPQCSIPTVLFCPQTRKWHQEREHNAATWALMKARLWGRKRKEENRQNMKSSYKATDNYALPHINHSYILKPFRPASLQRELEFLGPWCCQVSRFYCNSLPITTVVSPSHCSTLPSRCCQICFPTHIF